MSGGRSSDPIPVANLLDVAVPQLAEPLLEARIRREWRHLVGPDMAARCQPGDLRARVLHVAVDNSPWLQELALRESDLLRRLNEHFGSGAVRSLRFSIGPVAPDPTPPFRSAARRDDRLTAEDTRLIDAAVALIGDPDLQERARRLLEKACRSTRQREGIT